MDPRCPDCDVPVDEVEFGMKVGANDAWDPYVKTGESRGGLLGTIGLREKREVEATLCPECDRVRFYAPGE